MRKRMLSLLLCLVLLAGLLPAGTLSLPASGETPAKTEPEAAIQNLFSRYEAPYIIFSCDPVPEAKRYDFNILQYNADGSGGVAVASQSPDVVVENSDQPITWKYNANNFYYHPGDGRLGAIFSVSVTAYNKYGEALATGSSNFQPPFERYLDPPQNGYLSCDGMFYFDPVPDADSYDVSMRYHGNLLWKATDIHTNYIQATDLREGDQYTFTVTAYPKDKFSGPLIRSQAVFDLTYAADTPISGRVKVNADHTLTYSGFLGYLQEQTDVTLLHRWERFDMDTEAWSAVPQHQIGLYDASLLRVTVTAPGYPGEIVSPNAAYSNPDLPYVATDIAGLYRFFHQTREEGSTVYVKLGNDIRSSGGVRFQTFGGNVVMDLCGHTLSYRDKSGTTGAFLWGYQGNVIINDSRRYDAEAGTWIDGRIEFEVEDPPTGYRGVLAGGITLNGGIIVNKNHSTSDQKINVGYLSEGGYSYGRLIMNGGEIDADYPVIVQGYDQGYPERLSAINGGTLRVRKKFGITITSYRNAEDDLPTITNCTIINGSGNSQIYGLQLSIKGEHTSADIMEKLRTCFRSRTVSCIDGFRQNDVLDGMIFNGVRSVYGPQFYSEFELSTQVALDDLELTITAPEQNALPDYSVYGADMEYYDAALTWLYQDRPNHFAVWEAGRVFRSGVTYRAQITLIPRDFVEAFALNPGKKVYINGKAAAQEGLTFTADFTVEDVCYDVWLGSVQVTRGNRGDVLGDGGSVQFYERFEYVPDERNAAYGTEFIRNTPVLVLNNFEMSKVQDDYHTAGANNAQLYIGIDLAIVLKGENTFHRYGSAHGIYVAKGRYLSFHGDGSLTVDKMNDHDALRGTNVTLWVREEAKLNLNGFHGVYLMNDGGTSTVNVTDGARLSCDAYLSDSGLNGRALNTFYLRLSKHGQVLCRAYNGPALATNANEFPNDQYDIRILKLGEYEGIVDGVPGKTPYAPQNGLNVSGGVAESQCRYVSLQCRPIDPTNMFLDQNEYWLNADYNQYTLTAYFLPNDLPLVNDALTWASSDPAVVWVSPDPHNPARAVITGLKNGTATVTARTGNGISSQCTVHVTGFTNPFTDVPDGKWFTDAVVYCYANGLMTGTSETAFSPNASLTRAMFVTILSKVDGADTSPYTGTSFTDVKTDKWYSKPIEWAYQNGYTSGVGNGRFGLNDPVTRQQLAVFLYTYTQLRGCDVSELADLSTYADADTVAGWARTGMQWAIAAGLISGTGENSLSPRVPATRAQVAQIIMKYSLMLQDLG